jgi:small subunit ribosomal protein S16
MLKKHLIEGVKKGALTEDQAEQKFNKWLDEKASKITGKNDRLINESSKQSSDRLKAETASKEAKAAKVAAKLAVVVEAKAPEDDNVIIDSPPSEETNS